MKRYEIALEIAGATAIWTRQAYPGLFAWNLDYDDFIGYMRGAIKSDQVKSGLVQIV